MQAGGGAIAGIQTLPSTGTEDEQVPAGMAYLGMALMASGAFMLLRQRPQKPFIQ